MEAGKTAETSLLTQDRRMQDVLALAATVAQSKATVLIQGESGTGKELMAALIYEKSTRASKPFIAINCAAIPENLLESELFGYERGAFTGAITSKAGKFEIANGGTLLLDEISEMDIRLQAKLLRVLQEGEVDRLGGRKPVPVDVRILATTNRNLTECVRAGTFREDLFYRLNVVNLTMPPLRERTGDVRVLAEHYVKHFAAKNAKPLAGIASDALHVLDQYPWPGNVRELENVLERAVITCKGSLVSSIDLQLDRSVIERVKHGIPVRALAPPPQTRPANPKPAVAELPRELPGAAHPQSMMVQLSDGPNGPQAIFNWVPGTTLDNIEKTVILEALQYHQGNRTHTARALGISIRTLRNKLADFRKLGIRV